MLKSLLFAVVLFVSLNSHCVSTQGEQITVAIDINFAPYSYLDNQGPPQGLIVDYWALWQQEHQIKVNIKLINGASEVDKSMLHSVDVFIPIALSK
ncbi:transporter substrate-binding domain-containing protein [Psychrobium sp. nBUS_13]|uniref:transporter substrate-binding domain-containing protein n=1 Tax=Psychrobium sp. nBUS_13 TaxID=3395319 RepID=UPI003EBD55F6